MKHSVSPNDYTANLVGSLSLGLAGRLIDETEELVGAGPKAPAALILIGSMPNLTIDTLRHGIQLTHSATVRTVIKLNEAGLVEKLSGQDGRSVYLRLTANGRKEMTRVLRLREGILAKAISVLSKAEIKSLATILCKMLPQVVSEGTPVEAICRLCDGRVCSDEICPLTPEQLEHCYD